MSQRVFKWPGACPYRTHPSSLCTMHDSLFPTCTWGSKPPTRSRRPFRTFCGLLSLKDMVDLVFSKALWSRDLNITPPLFFFWFPTQFLFQLQQKCNADLHNVRHYIAQWGWNVVESVNVDLYVYCKNSLARNLILLWFIDPMYPYQVRKICNT